MVSLRLLLGTLLLTCPFVRAEVFSDPLLPTVARAEGSPLKGSAMAEGGATWSAVKTVTIGASGATSSAPNGAHHALTPVAGTIRVEADIQAKGSGFTGLALGRGDLSGNFWQNLAVLFSIGSGQYQVTVGSANLIAKPDKALLKSDAPNHLELQVDTLARTVTAKLNGTAVLDAAPLPAEARLADISAAGFRFNEPLTAGAPALKNYRAETVSKATAGLELADVATTFVLPDRAATLRWSVKSAGPGERVPYVLRDFAGQVVEKGEAKLAGGAVTITRAFPRGFFEVAFPEANQAFGVVALEPHAGAADPFFCIDAGLSWLEPNPARREGLIKILARSGIAASRERLGLGSINPAAGKYHWEGDRAFDTIRKVYADQRVSILEILTGGPTYLGKPPSLAGNAQAWADVAKHWPIWAGAEVGNEPDIQSIPAEQYVPQVKMVSRGLRDAAAPVVAGVFATIPPGPFFETCQANGMLEATDVVSFHSYDRAPDVEPMVTRFRTWLRGAGKEALPLWHTECGWAWVKGPDRPPAEQDRPSALEIAAKAVETKACGGARYFPFVYVFYEEGKKNFGMMGREATPLRSMAAYAVCARELSGLAYLGDLPGLETKRARVFGDAKNAVAVLYTGKVDDQATIKLPFTPTRVSGADGRPLVLSGPMCPIPDGLAYVHFERAAVTLQTDTPAQKLYALGQKPLTQKRHASPIIMQFLAEQTPARVSTRGYLVSPETARQLPLHVRLHNTAPEAIRFTPEVTLPGQKPSAQPPLEVPAMGFADLALKLDASTSLDIAAIRFLTIGGRAEKSGLALPLAIPLVVEGSLEQHLARFPHQAVLPATEPDRWRPNMAGHGKATYTTTAEKTWLMDLKFGPGGGYWAYPKLPLAGKVDPARYSGFVLRARVAKPASGVAIIAGAADGTPTFWVTDLFPADGAWHVVHVPFSDFKVGPGGTGNQNTRLDPATWKEVSIGMGSKGAENSLEISHLLLVGGEAK